MALWLAGPDSGFVTGEAIRVDGGLLAGGPRMVQRSSTRTVDGPSLRRLHRRHDRPTAREAAAVAAGRTPSARRQPRCFSASRADSGDSRSAWAATNARTHAGSVLACSRSAQPMALAMKKRRSSDVGRDDVGQQRRRPWPPWRAVLHDDRRPSPPHVVVDGPSPHERGQRRRHGPQDRSEQRDGDRVDMVPPRAGDDEVVVERHGAGVLPRPRRAVGAQVDGDVALLAVTRRRPTARRTVASHVARSVGDRTASTARTSWRRAGVGTPRKGIADFM